MRDLRGVSIRTALGCLVLAAVVLTGCSEKQEASTTLPPTAAAPTTEALPPLGPADFPVPEEARTKDAAGAEAFLRYFLRLADRQQTKLDGEPFRQLGPECYECLRIAKAFDEAAAAGHRYVGGELSLNDVAEPLVSGNEASIIFGVRQEAVRLVDAAGKDVVEGLPVQPNLGSGITMVWSNRDQAWQVLSLTLG